MRITLLALVFALFASLSLEAQDKQYTSTSDSDPEAIKLVNSLRKKYDAYSTLSADFRLDITLPNNPMETQKGALSRRGDEVHFKLGDQEGIINAEAAYLIQHANKEVMINNLPEDGETNGMLTPQTLFSFYEGDNFILAFQGEKAVNGRKLTTIELKPVDRDNSEFTKLRLLIDAAKKELVTVKAFSRDGSSFAFHLDKTNGNVALGDEVFTFNKASYPGYHVEDLRF
ncbi:LolA family protein [Neolewinella agarilytica]|uniref:LolA family protein n=1 Tax=Neolewinella agarilytica TaxID=478744 RepID=UPI0023573327|nr:outer membrane lipoprotein carrier protein LolA [Neolewinella agarilytica]